MIGMEILDYVVDVIMSLDSDGVNKIIRRILGFCLIAAVYFLERMLHNKKPPYHPDAVMRDRAPYIKIMRLKERIGNNGYLSEAKKAVGSVEERLRNESDFGYGDSSVIACENTIFKSLKSIEELLESMEGVQNESCDQKYFEQTADTIVAHCEKILSELRLRRELKKK